jgi:hypothetical protein
MIPATWILEASTPAAVVTCADPAETLARLARGYGVHALRAAHYAAERDDPGAVVYDEVAERDVRAAWRFALAALALAAPSACEQCGGLVTLAEPGATYHRACAEATRAALWRDIDALEVQGRAIRHLRAQVAALRRVRTSSTAHAIPPEEDPGNLGGL